MIRLRPATEADAERAAGLVIAVDIAEMGEPDYSLEDLHDEWRETGFELARDAVVAEAGDGTTIGYAHFRSGDLLAVVDPAREGEGAGTALLEWAERRGRERGMEHLRQAIGDRAVSAPALLQANGWAVARSYYRLERDCEASDTEPAGMRVLTRDDAPALYAIHEAAFAGRPDHTPRPQDAWIQREFGAHNLDLSLSRITEGGEGFALTRRFEEGIAYINLLAVHPDAGGRGLGTALLQGVFAAAAADGLPRVILNVASDNPSALRLYERVGMTQRWRVDDYQKPL